MNRLPKGWRWLKFDEWTRVGDVCCDPRTKPVKIVGDGQFATVWKMTAAHHPVRRKVK